MIQALYQALQISVSLGMCIYEFKQVLSTLTCQHTLKQSRHLCTIIKAKSKPTWHNLAWRQDVEQFGVIHGKVNACLTPVLHIVTNH